MKGTQRPDYEVEVQCRCPPSHSNFHGPKGCEHLITRFRWNRSAGLYDQMNIRCNCPVKGEIPVKEKHKE